MPFKVVQTTENRKPVFTAVPNGWEKDGTLFWPKNQADKLIKVEDIYPEENWLPMPCELKRDNLSNYNEAQAVINSILCRGIAEPEETRNQSVEPSTSSRPHHNLMELKMESISQEPLVYEEQTPVALSAGMELILKNQQIMLENQKKMMRKLNDLNSKLNQLVSRRSDMQCSEVRDDNPFTPIGNVEGLDEFENNLKDPEKRNSYYRKFSVICKGKGVGVNCSYILIDVLFTRKFLTNCSWCGGSRNGEAKIAFKAYNNTINFFHSLIYDCDKNYSLIDCHNFLKLVLRNSLKRYESKGIRASRKKSRLSKTLISEIRMSFMKENDGGDEYEESGDGLEESGNTFSMKRIKHSEVESSEGETDMEKELNESDGCIRLKT